MAVSIDQKPLYATFPVGQQVVFSISLNSIVATMFKVKFVAEVYISNESSTLISAGNRVGTFKTTPNNKGVGIFDFSSVLETFVKPDHQGSTFGNGSRYKTDPTPTNYIPTHPIHLIDQCAVSENSIRYLAFVFKIEYATTSDGAVGEPNNETTSISYKIFNGVLQYDDVLTLTGNDYGYNIDNFFLNDTSSPGKFLSNAPTTQYARLTDYGTFPFFNFLPGGSVDRVIKLRFKCYDSSGVLIPTYGNFAVNTGWTNGGSTSNTFSIYMKLMYYGVFPANLRNNNTDFQAVVALGTLDYYTVQAEDNSSVALSELYRINIICPNERGYEGIRLTWLNQWGVWDYYTFNMKSTRALTTNRTSYTQLGGTWNESTFKVAGYKGGKKNFRVNSTEKITLNTDFVTEAEGVWFEELINSTEVYILNGFDSTEVAPYPTITNKYVEPVVLTTSSYVKKTIANDKIMQYTIEIEKSKMKRTQSV